MMLSLLILFSILFNALSFQLHRYGRYSTLLAEAPSSSVESLSQSIISSTNPYKSASFEIHVNTLKGISFHDITPQLKEAIKNLGIQSGSITVLTRHTTTAITINEMEGRLIDDARQFLLKLVPPLYPYLHNDIHLRSGQFTIFKSG